MLDCVQILPEVCPSHGFYFCQMALEKIAFTHPKTPLLFNPILDVATSDLWKPQHFYPSTTVSFHVHALSHTRGAKLSRPGFVPDPRGKAFTSMPCPRPEGQGGGDDSVGKGAHHVALTGPQLVKTRHSDALFSNPSAHRKGDRRWVGECRRLTPCISASPVRTAVNNRPRPKQRGREEPTADVIHT